MGDEGCRGVCVCVCVYVCVCVCRGLAKVSRASECDTHKDATNRMMYLHIYISYLSIY